jgi:hypothetical protein
MEVEKVISGPIPELEPWLHPSLPRVRVRVALCRRNVTKKERSQAIEPWGPPTSGKISRKRKGFLSKFPLLF